MCKGCKIYAILALNEKGEAEGLENLPVVQEFAERISRRVSRFTTEKRVGVYNRLETWN
jgi:hypothetical protein